MRTFEFGNFVRELARNIPMELQTNVRFGSWLCKNAWSGALTLGVSRFGGGTH